MKVLFFVNDCLIPLEMFYFILTRYLDTEIVSASSGAPCPLEEIKDVCKGKVISVKVTQSNIRVV